MKKRIIKNLIESRKLAREIYGGVCKLKYPIIPEWIREFVAITREEIYDCYKKANEVEI